MNDNLEDERLMMGAMWDIVEAKRETRDYEQPKKRFSVSYVKKKYLHIEVEAYDKEDAIDRANEISEKFGSITETPYEVCNIMDL